MTSPDLTREQRAAVAAEAHALEIRAGAGAGKTRTLAHRVARLAADDPVRQSRLLVVTFTREATASLERRLAILLGRDHHVRVSSFHQWAARMLPPRERRFLPEAQARALVAEALQRQGGAPGLARAVGVFPGSGEDVTGRVLGLLSYVKNSGSSLPRALAGPYEALLPWHDVLETVRAHYEAHKGERLDYDDLLLRFRDLLRQDAGFRRATQASLDHVFVDEFQDVNRAQAETVHLVTTGEGAPRVTVVGDVRQSIYGFRGGSPRHLEEFLVPYGPRGARLALTHNFRATQALVQAANVLLPDERPMRAPSRAPRGTPPRMRALPDAAAEADHVADHVESLLADGADPAEVAVLVRARFLAAAYGEEVVERRADDAWLAQRPEALDAAVDALVLLAAGQETPLPLADPLPLRRALRRAHDPRGQAGAFAAAAWTDRTFARAAKVLARRVQARPPRRLTARELLALPAPAPRLGEVAVTTIHGAKGLEWDHVVLLGAREGGLPIEHALRDEQVLEEERRLLYVALTRARRTFLATWPARGARRAHEPCRWLAPLEATQDAATS